MTPFAELQYFTTFEDQSLLMNFIEGCLIFLFDSVVVEIRAWSLVIPRAVIVGFKLVVAIKSVMIAFAIDFVIIIA